MAEFFAELKRRHIYRVAAAYAVLAWLLLQLVNNLAQVLDLPIWVARALLLLLIIGFPVTLLIAWLLDLKSSLSPNGVEAKAPTTKLDYVLVGALILVIGLVSYQQLAPATGTNMAQQASVATSSTTSPTEAGSISIAVLPFANMSGDTAQEFFSDGMSEEIITALSRVPSLQVVARTSAFEFKNQNRNIRAIGQALSARYVIDGSVRKAGNRVRIAAQLIQADNGVNVWANSYDRELTDVFAVQEEIAGAIATALRAPLGLHEGERLVVSRTTDLDSYERYLRARALYRARDIDQAIMVLESVVARAPNYAPAWGLLAQSYVQATAPLSLESRRSGLVGGFFERAEKAAQEATRLDSRNANGYAALADMQYRRGNWAAAGDIYRQALAHDQSEPDVLVRYSVWLAAIGRLKEAESVYRRVLTLEPLILNYNLGMATAMQRNGQYEASIRLLEPIALDGFGGVIRNRSLASAYAAAGRYSEAADTLLAIKGDVLYSRRLIEDAARLLRTAPAKAVEPLPDLEGSLLSFVYAHVGAVGAFDRVLEENERDLEQRYINGFGDLWRPEYAPLRKTERFRALMRRAGLVDYWRAKGWPDLCRPAASDDFVCD